MALKALTQPHLGSGALVQPLHYSCMVMRGILHLQQDAKGHFNAHTASHKCLMLAVSSYSVGLGAFRLAVRAQHRQASAG
jgi:hypothetical protein